MIENYKEESSDLLFFFKADLENNTEKILQYFKKVDSLFDVSGEVYLSYPGKEVYKKIGDIKLSDLQRSDSIILNKGFKKKVFFKGEEFLLEDLVSVFVLKDSYESPSNSLIITFNGNFYSYSPGFCTKEDVSKNLKIISSFLQPLLSQFEFLFGKKNLEGVAYIKQDVIDSLTVGF